MHGRNGGFASNPRAPEDEKYPAQPQRPVLRPSFARCLRHHCRSTTASWLDSRGVVSNGGRGRFRCPGSSGRRGAEPSSRCRASRRASLKRIPNPRPTRGVGLAGTVTGGNLWAHVAALALYDSMDAYSTLQQNHHLPACSSPLGRKYRPFSTPILDGVTFGSYRPFSALWRLLSLYPTDITDTRLEARQKGPLMRSPTVRPTPTPLIRDLTSDERPFASSIPPDPGPSSSRGSSMTFFSGGWGRWLLESSRKAPFYALQGVEGGGATVRQTNMTMATLDGLMQGDAAAR